MPCAWLKASRVLAAPHEEIRNCRRERPRRFAFSVALECARRLAARFASDSGTGMNSPLEVESSLMGRRESEEHTSELQSRLHLVCRLLLEKKKKKKNRKIT